MSWYKIESSTKAAIIALTFVINILSGALIIYLQNPIWIGIFLGSIIISGLFGLWFYILFLFEFITEKVENKKIKEFQKELESIKRK